MNPPPGGGGGGGTNPPPGGGGGGGTNPPPGGGGGGGGLPPGGGGGGKSDIRVLLSRFRGGRANLEAVNDPCLHRQRVRGGEDDPDAARGHAKLAHETRGDQHKPGD